MTDEFRDEIAELAARARKEILEKQELARSRPAAKRMSQILRIGGFLILAQAAILTTQLVLQRRIGSEVAVSRAPHPLLDARDCRGAVYRAYRAAAAFRRVRGEWPRSLDELVEQRYLPELPVDPRTGAPLRLTSGERFTLECSPLPSTSRSP